QAEFPNHPVKIIVPFAPGGPTDVTGRIIAELLSSRWNGQSVIVENRPGAGTIVGTTALAKSPPDGYTIGLAITAFEINPAIGQKLPYDTLKDFAPLTSIGANPIALVANPAFPASTVPELVAYAKTRPEPLNFTSPGARGAAHLAGEWLKALAGIRMQHISYNGSAPALVDVIAGRVPIMFDPWHSSRPHFLDGKLKLIAAAGAERLKDQPLVATIGETYPGFDVSAFQFLIAPAGVPMPVLDKLTADLRAVIDSPEFAARAARM